MREMLWPVAAFIAASLAVGVYTCTKARGKSKNFMVCGRSLPLLVAGTTLVAQSVDGNSSPGNAALCYAGGFLAPALNRMNLLSLPDFFGRRYVLAEGTRREAMPAIQPSV